MFNLIFLLLSTIFVQGTTFTLTEAELREYDGTKASKPIYVAINGTIYDVSASPEVYGPGGHYHHFAGRDATRAWLTECWGEDDQLTWRMDSVEEMFMPRYMDEELERVAGGEELDMDFTKIIKNEQIAQMAQMASRMLGEVSAKQKAKRREEDVEEAKQKAQDTLAHWVGFLEKNEKYDLVGKVVLDELDTPLPPPLCQDAMRKRPIKGGKLDALVDVGQMAQDRGDENTDTRNFVLAQLNAQYKGKDEL